MWKIPKVTAFKQSIDGSPGKRKVVIRKQSRVPGVMITQYVEQLPEGKSTPDIIRKPMAVTINEGKVAVFRAVVAGDPSPKVTWGRNNGDVLDPEIYQTKYDNMTEEHILQISNVSIDQADTYKCFATNEFGRAFCTVFLKINEVGIKKKKPTDRGAEMDFRKMLKKTVVCKKKPPAKKEGEVDPQFWNILLSAEKKQYERICAEYGFTDFRFMLKKLTQMKKEREEEQAKYVKSVNNLKPIEVTGSGTAAFELDMELKDPTSNIFLFKDGEMVEYGKDGDMKYNMKQSGKKYVFSVKDLVPEDAGLYQVDVEDTNVFSTDLKLPPVEFLLNIKDTKASEGQDAHFECTLSYPLPSIIWMGNNKKVEAGEKYNITVSEDQLIHKLVVKCCNPEDKGLYSAIAGIQCSSASLRIKDTGYRNHHSEKSGTPSKADDENLDKIGPEQQAKAQMKREEEEASKVNKMTTAETFGTDSRSADSGGGSRSESGRGGSGCGFGDDNDGSTTFGVDNKRCGVKEPSSQCVDGSGFTGTRFGNEGLGANGFDVAGVCGPESDRGGYNYKKFDVAGVDGKGTGGPADGVGEANGKRFGGEEIGAEVHKSTGADGVELGGSDLSGAGCKADESGKGSADNKGKTGSKTDTLLSDVTKGAAELYFTSRLSDVNASLGQHTELLCKLSNANYDGVWYKDGKKLTSTDKIEIIKDGPYHKLQIKNVQEGDSGKYIFEANGCKTESMVNVQDPPRLHPNDLSKFSEPLIVRTGENATFNVPFLGREPMAVQWYRDGKELLEDVNVRLEKAGTHSQLLMTKCHRKDSGEIKIKIKNEFGTVEASSRLVVLDKPSPPQSPVEVTESSSNCIAFKWRAPKDDGGSPVTNYILERQQVGRNTWKKIGEIPGQPSYRDTDVVHGRRYRYRLQAKSVEGVSGITETDDIMAGTKVFPNAPGAPKAVRVFKDCINLLWPAPTNTGGANILGYHLETRKKGSRLWTPVNPPDKPIQEKTYAVRELVEGAEYEFRVTALNHSGAGEPSVPSDFVMARDPKKPPGKVMGLKVTDSTSTSFSLSWNKPQDKGVQDEAKGYFVEIRPKESTEWMRCNSSPISTTYFTVTGLKYLALYWLRVIAVNEGGEGKAQELDTYILAMPPPVKPAFKYTSGNNLKVVRAGYSLQFNIKFDASPLPDVIWLKDGMPVSKRVTVSNTERRSQLLIPCTDCSDSGVYTIIIENLMGKETLSTEVRVTDDPKPPGPVHLEQNVPGTVTLCWASSPDETHDDRLHYMVSKHDATKQSWHTVGDRIYNNKFTIINIIPGREYRFRVYAKNDTGQSEPSESTTWETKKKKDKFVLNIPEPEACSFQEPPSFTVPLKICTARHGYECYMSCAVRGDPAPRVTWYHDNININADANYYITNTCGVCSLMIIRVGVKDVGEYKVIAENALGRAESTTTLTVRGIPY